MSGRVVHFEIPFDDGDRAAAFYARRSAGSCRACRRWSYTMVIDRPERRHGPTEPGFINGGMMSRQDALRVPVIAIDVDDIDDSLGRRARREDRLRARSPSATWASPPTSPTREGNVIGLWETAG